MKVSWSLTRNSIKKNFYPSTHHRERKAILGGLCVERVRNKIFGGHMKLKKKGSANLGEETGLVIVNKKPFDINVKILAD